MGLRVEGCGGRHWRPRVAPPQQKRAGMIGVLPMAWTEAARVEKLLILLEKTLKDVPPPADLKMNYSLLLPQASLFYLVLPRASLSQSNQSLTPPSLEHIVSLFFYHSCHSGSDIPAPLSGFSLQSTLETALATASITA